MHVGLAILLITLAVVLLVAAVMFFGSIVGLAATAILASLGVIIWGIVDAAGRSDDAWTVAGQSKTLWIAIQAAGFLFCGVGGLVMALVYLAAIRPKVQAAEVAGADGSPA